MRAQRLHRRCSRPWRWAGPRLRTLVTGAALLAAALPGARAAGELELKAAIVYNLLLFVEWPAEAVDPADSHLTLCVGAASPMAKALRDLERRPVGRLSVAVRELPAPSEARCHARYVDGSWRPPTESTGLLVISDDLPVPPASAAIVLRRLDTKLGFDLDLRAARRAGLQLSAKLSRLARTVVE